MLLRIISIFLKSRITEDGFCINLITMNSVRSAKKNYDYNIPFPFHWHISLADQLNVLMTVGRNRLQGPITNNDKGFPLKMKR